MTCREFVEFLWRYIDDELSPTERAIFDEHLAKCPHCVQYLQQYRKTRHISKAVVTAPHESIPADAPEDLIQAILQSQKKIMVS